MFINNVICSVLCIYCVITVVIVIVFSSVIVQSSVPEFKSLDSDTCTYTFEWRHAAACKLEVDTATDVSTCTVADPVTDFQFNLRPLKSQNGYIVEHDNTQFKVRQSYIRVSCMRSQYS